MHRLPINEGLRRKGLQLASRCSYCSNSDVESFLHVFLESETAIPIWHHFHARYGHPIIDNSMRQRCMGWWLSSKAVTYALTPSLILWNLWKNRNAAVFDGSPKSSSSIIAIINNELHNILMAANYVDFGINVGLFTSYGKRKQVTVRALKWEKPLPGIVKLNRWS